MGKKRKASGRLGQSAKILNAEPRASDSKLRVNTYEDVADSEDEFFLNHNKIALEEVPAQKRQRRAKEKGTSRALAY